MKINTKFTGNFDLNEVVRVGESHIQDEELNIINQNLKNFEKFMISYAPYTIVSDLASHDEQFQDGFSDDYLEESVDLNPMRFVFRIAKSKTLSAARAAFWLGFFIQQYPNDLSNEDVVQVTDNIYYVLKSMCHSGLDSVGRYLSYCYANRKLTLNQINKLGQLVYGSRDSISLPIMCMVITLAMYTQSKGQILHVINAFNDVCWKIRRERNRHDNSKVLASTMSDGINRFVLLAEAIDQVRYSDLEKGAESRFGILMGRFITNYFDSRSVRNDSWLLLFEFSMTKDDSTDVYEFMESVLDVINKED